MFNIIQIYIAIVFVLIVSSSCTTQIWLTGEPKFDPNNDCVAIKYDMQTEELGYITDNCNKDHFMILTNPAFHFDKSKFKNNDYYTKYNRCNYSTSIENVVKQDINFIFGDYTWKEGLAISYDISSSYGYYNENYHNELGPNEISIKMIDKIINYVKNEKENNEFYGCFKDRLRRLGLYEKEKKPLTVKNTLIFWTGWKKLKNNKFINFSYHSVDEGKIKYELFSDSNKVTGKVPFFESLKWIENNYKPYQFRQYFENKLILSDVNKMRNEGFTHDEILLFNKFGIEIDEGKKWKSKFNDTMEMKAWIIAFNYNEAFVWSQSFNAFDAEKWNKFNVEYEQALIFKNLNISPNEYSNWEIKGFSNNEIIDYRKNKIKLDEALDWNNAGFKNINDVIIWRKSFNPMKAKNWLDIDFNYNEAEQWSKYFKSNEASQIKKLNISFEEAVKFKNNNIDIKYFEWISKGISLNEAIKYSNSYTYNEYSKIKRFIKDIDAKSIRYSLKNDLHYELSQKNSLTYITRNIFEQKEKSNCKKLSLLSTAISYDNVCEEDIGAAKLLMKLKNNKLDLNCPGWNDKNNSIDFLKSNQLMVNLKKEIGCTQHLNLITKELFEKEKVHWQNEFKILIECRDYPQRSNMPFQFCYSSYSAKSPVVDILKENGERMRYFINDLINKDTLEIIIKENFTANFQAFTRDYRFRLHVNIATDTKNLFNLQLLDMESFNFNSYNY